MRPLPLFALGLLITAGEASAQIRRTVQSDNSRVSAFWARNDDIKGLGIDAEIVLYSGWLIAAEVVRLDGDTGDGDMVSGGLGWVEKTPYGRFAATYSWGKIDLASERHDRQIGRLIYSYDIGRDWQIEGSFNRYENPSALGDNLSATRFMFRYGNGGPIRLDLGYSAKDVLTGLPGGAETWIAGLSFRF